MQYIAISRILGFMLVLFSLSVVPPLFISAHYHDGVTMAFLMVGILELLIGLLMWFPFRNRRQILKNRDGFLIVTLIWVTLSFFAALPFYFDTNLSLSFTDCVFETVSGLTTTGATIFIKIEKLPHAILFYRQELQFLGGMGIVVLAVAILPMLGIGGMQLYRAETPGPLKDSKLTPRITETAKALWVIYIILNIACFLAYWTAGMDLFDALGESFGTISTGGFSMHSSSFAFYNSDTIDYIATFFMFMSGVSFALHFVVFQRRNPSLYWRDVEFRYYIWIVFIVFLFTFLALLFHDSYPHVGDSLAKSLFTVVSLATSTGFTNGDFSTWPSFVPILLMCVAIIGACGGSTSGGLKVMRFVLVCKQSMREMRRLIHPNGIYTIKFGRYPLAEQTVEAMWGFIAIYFAFLIAVILLLMAFGMDFQSAFSASIDTLANVGAGIGEVSSNFAYVATPSKWILVISMVAGRLEIFTLLLLFTPAFWRK